MRTAFDSIGYTVARLPSPATLTFRPIRRELWDYVTKTITTYSPATSGLIQAYIKDLCLYTGLHHCYNYAMLYLFIKSYIFMLYIMHRVKRMCV